MLNKGPAIFGARLISHLNAEYSVFPVPSRYQAEFVVYHRLNSIEISCILLMRIPFLLLPPITAIDFKVDVHEVREACGGLEIPGIGRAEIDNGGQ